jgi:hypothetical protein
MCVRERQKEEGGSKVKGEREVQMAKVRGMLKRQRKEVKLKVSGARVHMCVCVCVRLCVHE